MLFCKLYNSQAGIRQQMLYEKSLRQLNAVLPKLNIKSPAKKAVIRPLIQEIDAPYLSNNDFHLLRDKQTAAKPLRKMLTLVETWTKVLEANEKARQQQENKQQSPNTNFGKIEGLRYLLMQAEQVSTREQFILFVREKGEQVYGNKSASKSIKDFKQTYITKQREFYNTISKIGEEEYFHLLEELLEKLGILGQLIKHQIENMDHLAELNAMIESEDIFKKKDNSLNKVINYNLMRANSFAAQIENDRRAVYYYEDELTFAVARCYYLLYLAHKDLQEANSDAALDEIQAYISEKRQWVFPRLYSQKIIKPLILLDQRRKAIIPNKLQPEPLDETERPAINTKVGALQAFLHKNEGRDLSEQQFSQLFPEVQNLLILVKKHLRIEPGNQQLQESRNFLIQSQRELLRLFANDAQNSKSGKSRKILTGKNSRLSGKSNGFGGPLSNRIKTANHYSGRNTEKVGAGQQGALIIRPVDEGADVFLSPSPHLNPMQRRQKVQSLNKNAQEYQSQCDKYLQRIQPSFGEFLDDAENFRPEQLSILVQVEPASESNNKSKEILAMIGRNLIRPQITEQTLHKIFQPKLRFDVLKMLSEKLIEMGYKSTRMLDSPEFGMLPENLQKFIQSRSIFLKVVNKQVDKIIGIADIIARLQLQQKYDVCRYETYQTFLKVLLAEKQARSYALSFKDEKKVSRQTSVFVNNKIFGPFIASLGELLPIPYNNPSEIAGVLDQLEFFWEFLIRTNQIIEEAFENLASKTEKEEVEMQKRDLARILSNWAGDATERLKAKKDVFLYEAAEAQLTKLNEVVRICINDRSVEVKDPTALKMSALMGVKK